MPPKKSSKEDIISSMDDFQEDNPKQAFARRLRLQASIKSWKQAEIARRSGIKPALIGAYWHAQKMPSRENLFALADAFEVDPRWLSGGAGESASHLLDELDAHIESGEDDIVRSRRGELEGIAFDADLPAGLRNRADYILAVLGDPVAKERQRKYARDFNDLREKVAGIVNAALDEVAESHAVEIGPKVRQPMQTLCSFLLYLTSKDDLAGMLSWLVGSVATGFLEQAGSRQAAPGDQLRQQER